MKAILIFLLIIIVILFTLKTCESFTNTTMKNKSDLLTKIDAKEKDLHSMEVQMFSTSIDLYNGLKQKFASMYNPNDFTITIDNYDIIKQFFSVSQETYFQPFTLEGKMGKFF